MTDEERNLIEVLREGSELYSAGLRKKALDMIYDHVDDLMRAGEWETVNNLYDYDYSFAPDAIMLAVLVLTKCAEQHLPGYAKFRVEVEALLESRGEMEPRLLDNL